MNHVVLIMALYDFIASCVVIGVMVGFMAVMEMINYL